MKANRPDYRKIAHLEHELGMVRLGDHDNPSPWGYVMSGWQHKRPLPPDWNTRRAKVMRRDRGVCHVCGQPGADQVDHINPTGGHQLTNLAPIHNIPCHRDKTITERPLRQYRTNRRPPEQHPGLVK